MLFSWFLSDTGNTRKHFEAVQCGSMGITTTGVHPIQPGLYNRIYCTPLGGPDRGYLDGIM